MKLKIVFWLTYKKWLLRKIAMRRIKTNVLFVFKVLLKDTRDVDIDIVLTVEDIITVM